MENVRGRHQVKFVHTEKQMLYYTSRPQYHGFTPISPKLALFRLAKDCVELNQTLYVGAAILDLSKMLVPCAVNVN